MKLTAWRRDAVERTLQPHSRRFHSQSGPLRVSAEVPPQVLQLPPAVHRLIVMVTGDSELPVGVKIRAVCP